MKRDWADGYVSDVAYSHGYFHELAPAYLRFHLLVNGIACPSDGERYTYCELGYGQGVSAVLHAASNPRGEFWGTDFNPDHALNARSLSKQAGLAANWLDLGFEAFLDTDTPQFDFIVLHGVWSWVSAGAQHALVEFMRRKLKPGGVVFISYNVLPGWNSEKPLRDLLWLHTECASAPDAVTPARIARALEFARSLRRHGCGYFSENARASEALDEMLRQDPASLAHEYFNRSWVLTYFAEVERALQAASLGFACSVHLSDIAGEVRDRMAGAGFLDRGLGPAMRETTADFVLNRRFRRDVFTRGSLRLSPAEKQKRLDGVAFALLRPVGEIASFINTPYGRMPLDDAVLQPLLAGLDAACGLTTLGELCADPAIAQLPRDSLVELLAQLVARRDICPIFEDDLAAAGDSTAAGLNAVLADLAMQDDKIQYLASPIACVVGANRLERRFLSAWNGGARSAAGLARHALDAYGDSGRAADAALLEDFERRANTFVTETVPMWQRLLLATATTAA